ncbi:hypothetical protein FRB96_001653 [Tulasnella sp. 330]|nr:hypothetical protein FRB96_001653 [Tulasnella sp. 330]
MTISQDASAPLIVVVGATGTQGGSVIKALEESDKPYRMRGFTRDTSKPAAQELTKKGVEMVTVDPNPTPENKAKVNQAFEGATYAFAVTIHAVSTSKERESAEGKMFVDAAKAAKVKLFIWSGQENYTEVSGGKYTRADHFDAKAAVTQYCKDTGIPFVNVEAAIHYQNFLGPSAPRKQPDGTFAMFAASSPDSLAHLIDASGDYGLWVRKAIDEWPGGETEILTSADFLSRATIASTLSKGKFTGKTVKYVQISQEQQAKGMAAAGLPEDAIIMLTDMYNCLGEFGFYGGKDVGPSQNGLARRPRTFEEFVKEHIEQFNRILA